MDKKTNNLRLYKKDKATFNSNKLVHESASIEGKELRVSEAFEHYGYNSISVLTAKCNQYSTLKANEKFAHQKASSTLKLLLVFFQLHLSNSTFSKVLFFRGCVVSSNQ